MLDTLIIGAGISGLSLAHALQQHPSRRILVTERQGRVGGNIKTTNVAERLVAPFVSGVYVGNVHQLSGSAAFRQVTQLADAGGGLLAGAMLSHRQHQKPMTATDLSSLCGC